MSVASSLIASVGVIFPFLNYQMLCFDLIVNNICMALSFSQLNNEFNKCCCCCLKLQSFYCSKNRPMTKSEMNLSEMQANI